MKKGFTLAEVLITLAIIGVVAAITIPSIMSNTQQSEFKTGLRKAVSVLNSAVALGIADGVTPYDLTENYRLYDYLAEHMNIMSSTSDISQKYLAKFTDRFGTQFINNNRAFYTTDGMRFEFYSRSDTSQKAYHKYSLYDSEKYAGQIVYPNVCYSIKDTTCSEEEPQKSYRCGSLGLPDNIHDTKISPCLMFVDVNGDRKPNPANINCKDESCATPFKFPDPNGNKLTDTFTIMITDRGARPYGIVAQRAMYDGKIK